MAVVAHYNHRVGKVHEKVFQPADGLQVQTVGGLVQKQDVRLAKDCLGQKDTNLAALIQLIHHTVVVLLLQSQAGEHLLNLVLRLPATKFAVLTFQFTGPDTVLLGEVLLFVDSFSVLMHLIELWMAHHHRVLHGELVVGKVVLLENGHTLARSDDNLA